MIRFWKMKKTIATGMIMSSAAASLIGNCWPQRRDSASACLPRALRLVFWSGYRRLSTRVDCG
jgi:hypothetical protein